MNRRRFIKVAGLSGAASLLPATSMQLWGAPQSNYNGLYFLHLFADGAWDPTSFCDPKDDPVMNTWATSGNVLSAGNINYAPIADNDNFFKAHHKKTLVINGINARTNAHSAGRLYHYTGSQKSTAPGLAAMHAYEHGQGLAMPIMTNSTILTAGIVAPTLINKGTFSLVDTNLSVATNASSPDFLPQEDLISVKLLREMQAESLKLSQYQLPKQQRQIDDYYAAVMADTTGFSQLSDVHTSLQDTDSSLTEEEKAVKFAVSGFRSGLGVSASIALGKFDSHTNHDSIASRQFRLFTDIITSAWYYAEQAGIADRLVVYVSSDFGRQPYYNAQGGKDHWPIGSSLLMKMGEAWSNRVVGATTAGHAQQKINPTTLKVDNANGVDIEPKHVHETLRGMLGLSGTAIADRFRLDTNEHFDLLNPNLNT